MPLRHTTHSRSSPAYRTSSEGSVTSPPVSPDVYILVPYQRIDDARDHIADRNDACGNSRLKSWIRSGSKLAANDGRHASLTVPAEPSLSARASWRTCSMSPSDLCRTGSRSRPTGVSATLRLLRSNSRAPIVSSRRRICTVNAGCDKCSRTAARVKLPACATAMNARISRRFRSDVLVSITKRDCCHQIISIVLSTLRNYASVDT